MTEPLYDDTGLRAEAEADLAYEERRDAEERRRKAIAALPLQACVCCGRKSRYRWCSDSCRIAEDGPQEGYDY